MWIDFRFHFCKGSGAGLLFDFSTAIAGRTRYRGAVELDTIVGDRVPARVNFLHARRAEDVVVVVLVSFDLYCFHVHTISQPFGLCNKNLSLLYDCL